MPKSGFLLHIEEKRKISIVSDFIDNFHYFAKRKKNPNNKTPSLFMRQNPEIFKAPFMMILFVIFPNEILT